MSGSPLPKCHFFQLRSKKKDCPNVSLVFAGTDFPPLHYRVQVYSFGEPDDLILPCAIYVEMPNNRKFSYIPAQTIVLSNIGKYMYHFGFPKSSYDVVNGRVTFSGVSIIMTGDTTYSTVVDAWIGVGNDGKIIIADQNVAPYTGNIVSYPLPTDVSKFIGGEPPKESTSGPLQANFEKIGAFYGPQEMHAQSSLNLSHSANYTLASVRALFANASKPGEPLINYEAGNARNPTNWSAVLLFSFIFCISCH